MPVSGLDKTLFLAIKALSVESAGLKKSASQKRAEMAVQREAAKEIGISEKKSPTKKKGGSSRGG